jgi:phosphoribosyl 1,2-cyclic phosphodiesterase
VSQASIVRVLLTHLHLDHIQGLLFFAPLFDPTNQITVCGPHGHDSGVNVFGRGGPALAA